MRKPGAGTNDQRRLDFLPRILGRRSGGSSGATSRAALRLLGLLVLPIRGEAAWFVHIEHGDDNQHHEPERGMEDVGASGAAIDDHLTCLGRRGRYPWSKSNSSRTPGPLRALSQSQSRCLAVQAGQTGGRIQVGSGGRAESFQAGHASSILVTRSTSSLLVRSSFNVSKYSNNQITRMTGLVIRVS